MYCKRGISMSQKSRITELVLHWNDERNDERKSRDERIGEGLEVSSTSLKTLRMIGYKGVNIPKWMGESSASLTILELWRMENVEYIFTMNTIANKDEMNGTFFPLLEKLDIRHMKNLREMVSSPIPTTRAFPNLGKIHIDRCPGLGAFPPHLKSLKEVIVEGECSDELLDSISEYLSGQLTRLRLDNVNERSVLFRCASSSSNEMNGTTVVTLFPLLEVLVIYKMKNLRELVSPPISINTSTRAFPNLCKIEIRRCPKLGALPPHLKSLKDVTVTGECTDELLYSISNLSALTHLSLMFMDERCVLFGGDNYYYYKADGNENENEIASSSTNINELAQGGGSATSTFQSLQSLLISRCSKLSCLFDEEKLASGAGCLKNLKFLCIESCPELMISIEQWRNIISHSHSLQYLYILECPKLVPSKVEEAEEVLQLLSSLRQRLGTSNFKGDILNEGRRIRSRRSIFLCN